MLSYYVPIILDLLNRLSDYRDAFCSKTAWFSGIKTVQLVCSTASLSVVRYNTMTHYRLTQTLGGAAVKAGSVVGHRRRRGSSTACDVMMTWDQVLKTTM